MLLNCKNGSNSHNIIIREIYVYSDYFGQHL